MGYGNGMHVDTGMRFSMNLVEKNLLGKFPVIFVGTSIEMPMYSGNKFFKNSGHSKFGCTENSQENAGSILLK